MVSIGLAGTLCQWLLLFVLASLFAHLKFPLMVAITGILVCLHFVVYAKSFSSSLAVSAFSSLCVPPPQSYSWFVFLLISMHPFKQACSNSLFQLLHNGSIDFAVNPFGVTNAACRSVR